MSVLIFEYGSSSFIPKTIIIYEFMSFFRNNFVIISIIYKMSYKFERFNFKIPNFDSFSQEFLHII